MDELQELIRRIKAKASKTMIIDGFHKHENGAIAFCRELCDELNLDAEAIRLSILNVMGD